MSVRKPIFPARQTSTSVNKNATFETSTEQIGFDFAKPTAEGTNTTNMLISRHALTLSLFDFFAVVMCASRSLVDVPVLF